MFKKLGLILCVSLFSMGTYSQLKFGVKGGANFTFPSYSVNSDTIDNPSTSGFGPVFGLFMDIPLAEGIIFMPEVNVSFRYYNSIVDDLFEDKEEDVSILRQDYGYHKLMYLEVPLLFRYNIRMNTGKYGRDNYLGIYAGPMLGLQLTNSFVGETTITYKGYEQTSIASSESSESGIEYKTFDLAVSAGVVYDMEKGFRVGLRFNRSLAAVNKDDAFSINHNVVQLTMGWNFIKQ